jgi:hypothetical protein
MLGVTGLDDREVGVLEHRFEQPGELAELVAQRGLEFRTCPARVG